MAIGDGVITLQDLGYAAGFIDGEGSIMIKRSIGGHYKLSNETLSFREECFQKARTLNKRGA